VQLLNTSVPLEEAAASCIAFLRSMVVVDVRGEGSDILAFFCSGSDVTLDVELVCACTVAMELGWLLVELRTSLTLNASSLFDCLYGHKPVKMDSIVYSIVLYCSFNNHHHILGLFWVVDIRLCFFTFYRSFDIHECHKNILLSLSNFFLEPSRNMFSPCIDL